MRTTRALLLLVGLLAVLAGCGRDSSEAGAGAEGEQSGQAEWPGGEADGDADTTSEGHEFKVGLASGNISIYMLPTYITVDRLNEQGWKIERVNFARPTLTSQAAIQNTVQIILQQYVDPLRSIQAGGENAQLKYVMENNGGEFMIVVRSDVEDCTGLDGQRFGIHGDTSTASVAAVNWLEKECGIAPTVLIIPGGDNRVVAMENGELDGSALQLADFLSLEAQSPGEYKILDTGDLFDISGAAHWVNTAWVNEQREVAVEYVAELLRTYRMIHEDPSILEAAAREYSPLAEDAIAPTVAAYLDPNRVRLAPTGGGTTDALAAAIDFFTHEIDDLDPGLQLTDVVHPDLLQEATEFLDQQASQ